MSRKIFIPLFMTGTIAASGAAYAADQTTGEIKSLNPAKHQFSLGDGQIFRAAKKVNLRDFQVGQTVMVTFDIKNGKHVASSLAMTEPKVFQNSESHGGGGSGEGRGDNR